MNLTSLSTKQNPGQHSPPKVHAGLRGVILEHSLEERPEDLSSMRYYSKGLVL